MEPQQKSNGALIGSIIIIIILIIGGVYMWQNRPEESPVPPENTLGGADELMNLEADVNSIDLEGIDSEI